LFVRHRSNELYVTSGKSLHESRWPMMATICRTKTLPYVEPGTVVKGREEERDGRRILVATAPARRTAAG
jgi:hypothetical protein